MTDDTMLNRKPFNNLLDYVKSKYLEQDHLWKERKRLITRCLLK